MKVLVEQGRRWALATSFTLLLSSAAFAQGGAKPEADNSTDLAKKLSNPVADLVSVPFQYNWENGVGLGDTTRTRFILNVQPVMPFSLNERWNLIVRVIMPLVGQPALFPGGEPASGLSDVLASFFFTPRVPRGFIWGIGPVASLPSTSEPTLGTGKWSAGPTVLILKQSGPATWGALWNQVWSFAGPEDRTDVNQMFVQPFLSFTNPKAVTFGVNSEAVANWEAPSGDQWTIPINVSVSKLSNFGPFPASYQVGAGVFVEKPEGGPDWKLRAGFTILLPRKK